MNIAEFARELDVSPTTVSHALSGQGRLSAATRQRVLEHAQSAGYLPNTLAQRLATGRSQLIALEWVTEELLTDIYSMQMARGIQHALQQHGYSLTFNIVSKVEEQDARLRQATRSRAVDGVISLGRFLDDRAILTEIATPQTPCVVISHTAIEGVPHVGSVVLGVEAGVRQLAALLVECGHRRIGYLGFNEGHPKVLRSFQRALRRLGVAQRDDDMVITERTAEGGGRGLKQLMAKPQPPTAVLARNDAMALGALQQAKALGLRVPQDLSIVGHDDILPIGLADPPLTTVRIDCMAVGRAAVEVLMQLLNEPCAPVVPRTLDTQLVQRGSVGAPPRELALQ
jgi:LacI family repressor for deo operon, udp, cdd, tsx, nupC, and nupG